ncbi:MAG: ATP-binding protein [Lachnospiraceae bacterium]|nr:ATP-binding protein [Lachnospiraceae bacterium]
MKNENSREMRFEAVVADIGRATEFVDQYLEEQDCPMKAQMQIDIAIDELFGNIVHYAYPQGSGPVWVRVGIEPDSECAGRVIVLTFRDCGIPYDPLSRKDPDTTLSLEEREPGGLGIYMVKKSMDALSYEYKDGQNVLAVSKIIT